MNVIEIERKINTDISDINLITYATEEDKWNDYVDKTIDFNKNYSIFTENKNKVDGNFETVTTNDNELSIILRNIRIKNAEINAVEREISRLDQEIIDAGKNQERIIKNASDDVLLDSYNLDLMRQDIIISNITDLNNYKNSTQTSLNVYSRYSNYKTKTTEEMTKLITDTQTTITNYTADRDNIRFTVLPLIDNNKNKNINNYTQLNKITTVPNSTELRTKYNSYNTNINTLRSKYELLKDQNNKLTQKNNEISSKQGEIDSQNNIKSKNEKDLKDYKKNYPNSKTRQKDECRTNISNADTNITRLTNEKNSLSYSRDSINNKINQYTNEINSTRNANNNLRNEIDGIRSSRTKSIDSLNSNITTYKISRLYNIFNVRINKIIEYINNYNRYDIPTLQKKKDEQLVILQTKKDELNNVLIPQKNDKITQLNGDMKTCKTNKDDLNDKLSKINEHINVCNSKDMCTNKCAKNILCNINEIFCSDESWFSIIEKQYIKYFYDISCSKIVNKTENGIVEPFTNAKVMEGFEDRKDMIYVNPNIDADIYYTNYYSKFIKNKLHPEDVSQNMLNLKRNIEIDTYFYLKYNAQIELLKTIIIVCCISLIGSVFYHNGLITSDMYTIYLSIVFGVGLFYIIYKVYDIFIRDENNFTRFAFEKLFSKSINVNSKDKYSESECE
jgi:predicted  nucleic acid-binding Zn-ribbon protein